MKESKFDEISKAFERMDYAVYKAQHDKIDKMMYETIGGKNWKSGLPKYEDLTNSQE